MKLKKVLNNNAVVVWLDDREAVAIGKGIAYCKKPGDELDENGIDQLFKLDTKEKMNHLQDLIASIPIDYIEVANQIVEYAKVKQAKPLNDSLLIHLADHIKFAVERHKDGLDVTNGLLWEIKQFYISEYEIGLEAVNMIMSRFNVVLPEDEAGFMALHIVNAELDTEMPKITEMTNIIKEILLIVKYHFRISYDEESLSYARFITHLKFFARRLIRRDMHQDEVDNGLFDIVSTRFSDAFACTARIRDYIRAKFGYELTRDEQVYLTIHIARVTKTNEQGCN